MRDLLAGILLSLIGWGITVLSKLAQGITPDTSGNLSPAQEAAVTARAHLMDSLEQFGIAIDHLGTEHAEARGRMLMHQQGFGQAALDAQNAAGFAQALSGVSDKVKEILAPADQATATPPPSNVIQLPVGRPATPSDETPVAETPASTEAPKEEA